MFAPAAAYQPHKPSHAHCPVFSRDNCSNHGSKLHKFKYTLLRNTKGFTQKVVFSHYQIILLQTVKENLSNYHNYCIQKVVCFGPKGFLVGFTVTQSVNIS